MATIKIDMEAEEIERYGRPEDRNRGVFQATKTFLMQGRIPLPRMTRIVDFYPDSTPDVFNVVVESPDIPSSKNGDMASLELDIEMHALSRDRAVPLLNMVEYLYVSSWKNKPETKAVTSMLGTADILAQKAKMLAATKEKDPFECRSPVYEKMKEFSKPYGDTGATYGSWDEFVTSLNEEQTRSMCVTLLESFWGKFKANGNARAL